MMTSAEIEIALWPRGARAEQEVVALLQRYHAQNKNAHARAHSMHAQNPWADVSHTMTYRNAIDINEIGASWVEGLVATHSLRPFSPQEFDSFGGSDAFLLPPWKARKGTGENTVYSIPYRADARLIFYRRDLLAQAGVDENTAFATPESVLQTLERLKEHTHVKSQFFAPITTDRHINLSFIASWVWSMGGDFINADGSQVTFEQPEALAGIAAYLKMANYITPAFRDLESAEGDLEFCKGNVAVALSGPWLYFSLQDHPEFAKIRENVGIASPPKQACHGGTHLVIWQHSVHEEAAYDFIRFLTSAQVQADLSGVSFTLPARLEAIQASPYGDDPGYQMIVKTIQAGRSYSNSPLWNIVEDRLSHLLSQIGLEYFETPNTDLGSFLALRLKPLARRINITLAS
jgi:multiple sugar transport system substrate-binding protein